MRRSLNSLLRASRPIEGLSRAEGVVFKTVKQNFQTMGMSGPISDKFLI